MHVVVGSSRYHVVTQRYKNCDVTSWRSHSRLLERAIVNIQAPGDRKNPSVLSLRLMVKIQVKYQQNWHLRDSLLLFVFFQCQ